MTLFEFTFGLQAVILGLALTHLATAVNRLVMARERVKWAAQPLLAATLMLVALLLYWTQAWDSRQMVETTIGSVIVRVLVNLSVFAACAAVLPEDAPRGETVDLAAHWEKVRVYVLALFLAPIALISTGRSVLRVLADPSRPFDSWDNLAIVVAGIVCMVVKNRWVNIGVMAALLVWMVSQISGYQLDAVRGVVQEP